MSYHQNFTVQKGDPTIDGITKIQFEFGNPERSGNDSLITGIDRSIANGLRRVILSEVRTRGFAKNIHIPETFLDPNDNIQRGNLTIFNTEHLADRIGMTPIHDFINLKLTEISAEDNTNWTPPESLLNDEENWVFRICDANDPNLPLKHDNDGDIYNRQRYVKVKDIRVFYHNKLDIKESNTDNNNNKADNTNNKTDTGADKPQNIIMHSKEKISQVSSKINYIFLGKDGWTEMDSDFKNKIFKYPELILLSLKKGECVFAEMKVETGYGGVLPPNAMLPPANSHARWISAIPNYRFKTTKEFKPDYDQKAQIANALHNFGVDKKLAPILSRLKIGEYKLKKVEEYQQNIESSGFFAENSSELQEAKERLSKKAADLKTQIETDNSLAEELKKQKISEDLANDPVKDQKNYLLSKDPILSRYGNPEKYIINITYNGHLYPQDAWINAIQIMIEKLLKFKIIVNNIQDISGRITERASVKFDINLPEKLEIIIDDKIDIESHTLGNLIKCHYIYLLDYIIEKVYPDKYVDVWSYCFSNYKVPHPLMSELILTFITPGDNFPLFPGQGKYSNVTNVPNNPFSDLYNGDTNETLRLLKITCDNLINKFQDILTDAKKHAENLTKK